MQQLSYSCFWNGYVQCVILGIMISNLFTIIMNILDAVILMFHSPQPFQLLYFRNCKMRLVAYSSSRMPFSKHSLTCTTGLEVVCPHHLEDLPPLLRFLEWESGRQGLLKMETHFLRSGCEGGEKFPAGHFWIRVGYWLRFAIPENDKTKKY